MIVLKKDIHNAINKLNISNSLICLHSSLKSFGHLDGGAKTIIEAFLDENCTLIVPTFYYDSKVCPPPDKKYTQNGCDYVNLSDVTCDLIPVYTGSPELISNEMGAVPKKILKSESCIRGNHPINSFAAIGPNAEEIISCQAPLDVYAPLQKLYEKEDAFILLMGTDLTKATPIHYAEKLAGRKLFREWAKISNDIAIEAEVGSCSEGFDNLEPFINDIAVTITVGESFWQLFPFRIFIDRITDAIKTKPMLTHCSDSACIRCNDAIKGGPICI